MKAILIEIAPGELLDKFTILQIKKARITQPDKLRNVEIELATLEAARSGLPGSAQLDQLTKDLRSVNETLWVIEDDIRLCERDGDFGAHFIELARSVYKQNDRRAALKRQINDLLGSKIIEEKAYARYDTGKAPKKDSHPAVAGINLPHQSRQSLLKIPPLPIR